MSENRVCPIWGTPTQQDEIYNGDGTNVDSPRAGGKFFADGRSVVRMRNLNDREKARLTTWLIEQRKLGVERPEIWSYENYIESKTRRPDIVVHARADELLKYIRNQISSVEMTFEFRRNEESFDKMEMLARTESIAEGELEYLLNYLVSQDWLEIISESFGMIDLTITVEGYARLAELETVVVASSKAFVAMWFNESLDFLYPEAIEPAIKEAGYKASIINEEHFLDKIDDQIIAEIKRSRFVVADFTHGQDGARGSVYYEAGFAQGLGKDVIFTCRKDIIDNNEIHFDIRQYPYVVWEKNELERFRKNLTFRIERVIGDGPLKSVSE
ncbi:MAG: hypothetical protein F4X69_02575 [Gemmatimonadetes bacterium]|nr:hypothetical protein [Gemmatimonadota bacterium]